MRCGASCSSCDYREAQERADGDARQPAAATLRPMCRPPAGSSRRSSARGTNLARSDRGQRAPSRLRDPESLPSPSPRRPDEAAEAARPILAAGGTVAVKILSPDIVHKSDIGGVKLDLTTEASGAATPTTDILDRASALSPGARVAGVTVQAMVRRTKARELIAGIADDPTFGPVIVFGRGGTAVEVIDDKALALPPLDLKLAFDLIGRTRVSRILKAYRDVPAADEQAVALVLVKLAQLAADLPEVRELDINPFLADKDGVIAVDARVAVAPVGEDRKGSGPSPICGAALSQGVGAHAHGPGRTQGVRPSCPAGGRGAVPAVLQTGFGRGPAPALLCAGARLQPRLSRPPHADRLRARHRVRRDRQRERRDDGRGPHPCRCEPRERTNTAS